MTEPREADWYASVPVTAEMIEPAQGPYVWPDPVWIEGDHPTANPDGVTLSNVDYWPKTQEEKAQALLVPMVEVIDLDPTEPYPTGNPPDPAEAFRRINGYDRPKE